MAKKVKLFPAKELFLLYNNGQYQKVIAKTKQFDIDGISKEKLDMILLNSYEELSCQKFRDGDIQRALRDIEVLLKLSDDDNYKFLKLKYLMYMELFSQSIEYAPELFTCKNASIKKTAIFFYLLAKIYNKEYDFEKSYLKKISLTYANYVLGFLAFHQDNLDEALEYFEKVNPRSRQEKRNVALLKTIISNKESSLEKSDKALYVFLISGDATNLKNTKQSRQAVKELDRYFKKHHLNDGLKKLVALQSPTDTKEIIKSVPDKTKQTKLIYNNIVLLMEKSSNYHAALETFLQFQERLVILVESAMLLHVIAENISMENIEKKMLIFFRKYFELHHKKLAIFQIEFLFVFIFQNVVKLDSRKQLRSVFSELAQTYKMGHVMFLTQDLHDLRSLDRDLHQKYLEQTLLNSSKTLQASLRSSFEILSRYDTIVIDFDKEQFEYFRSKLCLIIDVIDSIKQPDKRNKKVLLYIFHVLSSMIQNIKISFLREYYEKLSLLIERNIAYYDIGVNELTTDIKALFVATETDRDIKVLKQLDYESLDEDDFLKLLFQDEESEYNFDESEYDLIYYRKSFIEHLKADKDPLQALKNFSKALQFSYYYNNTERFLYLFRLLSLYDQDRGVNDKFLSDFFVCVGLKDLALDFIRESFPKSIGLYTLEDKDLSLKLMQYTLSRLREVENVWYLKWIFIYLELSYLYSFPKDEFFKKQLKKFVAIYKKKKFASLKKEFNSLNEMFNIEEFTFSRQTRMEF